MLQRETYVEWADRFATMHGFRFGDDLDTLYSWYGIFGHYSLEELEYALLVIANSTDDAPSRKEQYRPLIHRAINRYRLERYTKSSNGEESQEFGTCLHCGGCGMLNVPHARCVSHGEWVPPYAEMGITCACRVGVLRRQTYKGDKVPWSLERYDRWNPHWRKQMAQMKAIWSAERDQGKREEKGSGMIRLPFNQLIDRLRLKFGGREPGQDEE